MTRLRHVDPDRPADPGWYAEHRVPEFLRSHAVGAADYVADEALVTACNVALALGAPLLVTGDPGTGKTQLAHWLVDRLGARTLTREERTTGTPIDDHGEAWRQPFALHTKSTTTWRDLLYAWDAVRYFHDGMRRQEGETQALEPRDYVTPGPLWQALVASHADVPSVVLIDEIDKAPRDFPNDLLHELDQYGFVVPEVPELAKVGVRRKPDRAPPLVVVTSNNERRLPDAFLRRCVFHHLELSREVVVAAVKARKKEFESLDDAVLNKAIDLLLRLANKDDRSLTLSRRPGTAELLSWLTALHRVWGGEVTLEGPAARWPGIRTLIKDRDDLDALQKARV
jgi:MoxR-like ATPase